MKKVLLCVLMMMAGALWLQAQTEAGSVLLGTTTELSGSMAGVVVGECPNSAAVLFESSKYESDEGKEDGPSTSAFNLSPRVGLFVADNVLIGASVSVLYNRQKNDSTPDGYTYTNTAFSGGPFARYYFALTRFQPFIQAGLTAGRLERTYKYSSNTFSEGENNYSIMSFGAGVGGAFFLSEKVSIDLLLNYAHTSLKDTDADSDWKTLTNSFGVGIGFSVFL